jgi:hypothetical protein
VLHSEVKGIMSWNPAVDKYTQIDTINVILPAYALFDNHGLFIIREAQRESSNSGPIFWSE